MWIHEYFFSQAKQQPEHLAVTLHQEQLTYGVLAASAERVAVKLLRLLEPSAHIGLHLAKSPQALVMMLACLRAGMVYVPIDRKCPIERRNFILEDSQIRLLVMDQQTADNWNAHPADCDTLIAIVGPHITARPSLQQFTWAEMLMNDDEKDTLREYQGITQDTLAYILYTSGSTGVPKGVMITHGNAQAFVEWGQKEFDITATDHVAVHAALYFDLPVFDIYVGLAKGATLYLIDETTVLFPEALYRFLRDVAVTVVYAVPSALIALVLRSSLGKQTLVHIRYLLYAGEEFHPNHLKALMCQLPFARVFNLYGPIETNAVTLCEVKQEHLEMARIPLGYPVTNTHLFLLDSQEQVIEEGEGEIVISGRSVTPGYLHLPEQTALTHCTIQVNGRCWTCYRTGDFARRDSNALLHFLGRKDDLIKTRGFRVEIGDIEATLSRHREIVEVAVIPLPHPIYTNLLYAFLVMKGEERQKMNESELLSVLCDNLPSYMRPQHIFLRTELPKTSTGKIARRILQDELNTLLLDK